jgi:transaldolase
VQAFRELTEDGININVTLIFSLGQYAQVVEAYLSALENRAAKVNDIDQIASVASIFVSRLDTAVDAMLKVYKTPRADALMGQIGIANAKMAYQHFKDAFLSERWRHLKEKDGHIQRILYGSTGVKSSEYPDVYYMENLIAPNTVITSPPKTLEMFLDHGAIALTLESELDAAHDQLKELAELGIDLDQVCAQLLDEGVGKFADSYDSILKTISEKKLELIRA